MNTLEILEKVRGIIEDEKHWLRSRHSATEEGATCSPLSKNAFAFCTAGAICRVMGKESVAFVTGSEPWKALCEVTPGTNPVELNDTGSHSEVLGMLDRAISKLKE